MTRKKRRIRIIEKCIFALHVTYIINHYYYYYYYHYYHYYYY